MGTRADFYIEENKKLNWIGSVAFDGYDVWESDYYDDDYPSAVKFSKTKEQFEKALTEYSKNREDWTPASNGWPWAWDNSLTTDMAYVFREDHLDCYRFGRSIKDRDEDGEYPNGESPKADYFPDMSKVKNVTDSGFLILRLMENEK